MDKWKIYKMNITEKIDKYLSEERQKKKKVVVNGEPTTIMFKEEFVERTYESGPQGEYHNKVLFHINDDEYEVTVITKPGRKGKRQVNYFYNGKKFPDNQKKVIEYILSLQ